MKAVSARRDEFDKILEELLMELPSDVYELLKETPVIVEDEPRKELLEDMGIYEPNEESDLCGLHWGVPLTARVPTDSNPDSPVILLFRGPIYRLVEEDKEDLREQIRITLLHELGHHFGFTEDDLEEMGYA